MLGRSTAETNPKVGKSYKYKSLVFRAIEGAIYVENIDTGDVRLVTVSDFMQRAKAIVAAGTHATPLREQPNYVRLDRLDEYKMFNDAEAACREAKQQGDPTDAEVQAFNARHRSRRYVSGSRIITPELSAEVVRATALPPSQLYIP